DLVNNFGVRLEGTKAVGKPLRHEQLVAFRGAQHDCDVTAVARRAPADVDRDIEDRAGGDADEFGLALRRHLEMQAAHDAAVGRERMIFLNESDIDAVPPQHILAKDLGEKAARVAMADRPDLLYLGNLRRNYLHAAGILETELNQARV